MKTLKIGEVTITRVEEWCGNMIPPGDMFIGFEPDDFEGYASWLAPVFYDRDSNTLKACVQSFLLRDGDTTILFDTGIGNDKERPNFELFHNMQTDFLDNLARAGAKPEDIDLVICSHLHVDHVGWNTRLVDGQWVPTFPNAKYLFSRTDYEFWNPDNDDRFPERVGAWFNVGAFQDSVQPIIDAGQALIFDDTHRVTEHLSLEPAPGHTPGLVMMKLDSEGEKALFVSDVMHNPVQIYRPDWTSIFCEDREQAYKTRCEVLEYCADNEALMIPAHFGYPYSAWIKRDDDGYAIKGWPGFQDISN